MKTPPKIDHTDHKILRHLTANAKLSISELSHAINLSATPTARRIKQLEDNGIITAYHAITCPKKLGYQLAVFVAVSLDKHTAERFLDFERQIYLYDEVISCSVVTGRSEDYLLKVVVRDMQHYEQFLLHGLSKINGVNQIHTSFEMRQVFDRQAL